MRNNLNTVLLAIVIVLLLYGLFARPDRRRFQPLKPQRLIMFDHQTKQACIAVEDTDKSIPSCSEL